MSCPNTFSTSFFFPFNFIILPFLTTCTLPCKGTLKPEAFASSCLHPSSELCVKDARGYTQAVGLCNHVLIMIRNPLCPTPSAPKEMLPGWVWGFLFLRNDATSGWDGFDNKEDAAEMTRVMKVARGRSKQLSLLSLSALTPIGILRIRKERWMTRGQEFPPIPSLLLPPNNKGTLKLEAFASSCLHPSSELCVNDTRVYTQVVGLCNHVLIMIRNPICPTPSAPKEMLPPYSCNQVSVGDGGDY